MHATIDLPYVYKFRYLTLQGRTQMWTPPAQDTWGNWWQTVCFSLNEL
jgi:hypothetical protein